MSYCFSQVEIFLYIPGRLYTFGTSTNGVMRQKSSEDLKQGVAGVYPDLMETSEDRGTGQQSNRYPVRTPVRNERAPENDRDRGAQIQVSGQCVYSFPKSDSSDFRYGELECG